MNNSLFNIGKVLGYPLASNDSMLVMPSLIWEPYSNRTGINACPSGLHRVELGLCRVGADDQGGGLDR